MGECDYTCTECPCPDCGGVCDECDNCMGRPIHVDVGRSRVPNGARIRELEATIERVRAVLAEGDDEGWVIIQKAKVRAALDPTTEGSDG